MEDFKKDFCNTLNKFGYKYSKWDLWNDFLHMAAISLANTMPTPEREEREEYYLKTINKYNAEEQSLFAELLAITTLALTYHPEQDFLGSLYHKLNLQQHQKGQYFTPYHIAQFMSEINFADAENVEDEIAKKGYITVNDCACGSGVMLIAFANTCRTHKINYQKNVLFIAQDIDTTAALMAYIQLSLLGCCAIIIRGNSLTNPGFHPDNEFWYTPMYYINHYKFNNFLYQSDEIA